MKFLKLDTDTDFSSARFLFSVMGITILLIVLVSCFSSILIISLYQANGVIGVSSVSDNFLNYYSNSVGLSVAFVAGFATIFLALQALKVSSNQTSLAAWQTFNSEVDDMRFQLAHFDRLIGDVHKKSVSLSSEVIYFLGKHKNDFNEPDGFERSNWEPVYRAIKLFSEEERSGSSEATIRPEVRDTALMVLKQHCEREINVTSGDEIEKLLSEWRASILDLIEFIITVNNPMLRSLIDRNIKSDYFKGFLKDTRKTRCHVSSVVDALAQLPQNFFEKNNCTPFLIGSLASVLIEFKKSISGPIVIDLNNPLLSDAQYEVAFRDIIFPTEAQFKQVSKFLPRPFLTVSPHFKSRYSYDLHVYYDVSCDSILYLKDHEKETKGEVRGLGILEACDSCRINFKNLLRENSEVSGFKDIFEMFMQLLSTDEIESHLFDNFRERGVDEKTSQRLASQYASSLPVRRSSLL